MKIIVCSEDKALLKEVAALHMREFKGFFLTVLGKGFLRALYGGYVRHPASSLAVAVDEDGSIAGFVAYSYDYSAFYKFLLKDKFFSLAWNAFIAFLKKPPILPRVLRAFKKSDEVEKKENYVEIASICVDSSMQNCGLGSSLINYVKNDVMSKHPERPIYLETDVENNDAVNNFYFKNGFELDSVYTTPEQRKMNVYVWRSGVTETTK